MAIGPHGLPLIPCKDYPDQMRHIFRLAVRVKPDGLTRVTPKNATQRILLTKSNRFLSDVNAWPCRPGYIYPYRWTGVCCGCTTERQMFEVCDRVIRVKFGCTHPIGDALTLEKKRHGNASVASPFAILKDFVEGEDKTTWAYWG